MLFKRNVTQYILNSSSPVFRISPPSPVEGGGRERVPPPPLDTKSRVVQLNGKSLRIARRAGTREWWCFFFTLDQCLAQLRDVTEGQIFAKSGIFLLHRAMSQKLLTVVSQNFHRVLRSNLNRMTFCFGILIEYM